MNLLPNPIEEARELLPCPFCGCEANLSTYETESLWSHNIVTYTQVGCEECGYFISSEPGFEVEAPGRWNTRASLSRLPLEDTIKSFQQIAANETPYSNATVRRMARIARAAISSLLNRGIIYLTPETG